MVKIALLCYVVGSILFVIGSILMYIKEIYRG